MSRTRDLLRWALPIAVSVGLLIWLFARGDIALMGVFRRIHPESAAILGAVLGVYLGLSLWIDALSLRCLTGAHDAILTMADAGRIKAASYLAQTLHYTIGVGALTVLVRRRAGLPLGDAAGLVLMIAAFDVGIAMVLAAAGILIPGTESHGVRAGQIIGLGVFIVAGFALLRSGLPLGPLERIRRLAVFRAVRLAPLPAVVQLLVLRLGFSLAFIALIGGALFAFGIRPPAGALIVNSLLLALVGALPIAVAGLGTGQLAMVELFGRWAESDEILLACSLALSAGIIAARASIGLVFAREYAREAIEAVRHGEAQ